MLIKLLIRELNRDRGYK